MKVKPELHFINLKLFVVVIQRDPRGRASGVDWRTGSWHSVSAVSSEFDLMQSMCSEAAVAPAARDDTVYVWTR